MGTFALLASLLVFVACAAKNGAASPSPQDFAKNHPFGSNDGSYRNDVGRGEPRELCPATSTS